MKKWMPLLLLVLGSFIASAGPRDENLDRIIKSSAGNKIFVSLIAPTTQGRWKELIDIIHTQNVIPKENLLTLEMYASFHLSSMVREQLIHRIGQAKDLGMIRIALCFFLSQTPLDCGQNLEQLFLKQITPPPLNIESLAYATHLLATGLALVQSREDGEHRNPMTDFLAQADQMLRAATFGTASYTISGPPTAVQLDIIDSSGPASPTRNSSRRKNSEKKTPRADLWSALKENNLEQALAALSTDPQVNQADLFPLYLDLLIKQKSGGRAIELIHLLAQRAWQQPEELPTLMNTLAYIFFDDEFFPLYYPQGKYLLTRPQDMSETLLVHALGTAQILSGVVAEDPERQREAGTYFYSLGKYYLSRHHAGHPEQLKVARAMFDRAQKLLGQDPLQDRVQALQRSSAECSEILAPPRPKKNPLPPL